MTLVPNEAEQALNRQYDIYAAAHYLCDEWDFCIVRADDPILKPRTPPEAT